VYTKISDISLQANVHTCQLYELLKATNSILGDICRPATLGASTPPTLFHIIHEMKIYTSGVDTPAPQIEMGLAPPPGRFAGTRYGGVACSALCDLRLRS